MLLSFSVVACSSSPGVPPVPSSAVIPRLLALGFRHTSNPAVLSTMQSGRPAKVAVLRKDALTLLLVRDSATAAFHGAFATAVVGPYRLIGIADEGAKRSSARDLFTHAVDVLQGHYDPL